MLSWRGIPLTLVILRRSIYGERVNETRKGRLSGRDCSIRPGTDQEPRSANRTTVDEAILLKISRNDLYDSNGESSQFHESLLKDIDRKNLED